MRTRHMTTKSPDARRRLLLVDDDPQFLELASRILGTRYEVDTCSRPEQVPDLLSENAYDVLLLDLYFDEVETEATGFDLIEELGREAPETPIIVLSRSTDMRDATRALDLGAFHFVSKHFERDELANLIDRAIQSRYLAEQLEYLRSRDALVEGDVIYKSPCMQEVMERVARFAGSDSPVLITGETGTGKDLVARLIHERSRPKAPFVAVNITSLPDSLFEAQLFGHDRGAFTDARESRKGLIELCDGGSIFLDEIGSLSEERQASLLRVIEDGRVRRVGSEIERSVDVRFLLATNEDLEARCEAGAFRRDLWFRVSSLQVHLPPLRERDKDVLYIADAMVSRMGPGRHRLSEETRRRLLSHDWPGNVRELRSVLERAVLYDDDGVIGVEDLERSSLRAVGEDSNVVSLRPAAQESGEFLGRPLDELLPYDEGKERILRDFRERCVEHALALSGNQISAAARMLGVSRQTLYDWMREAGYSREESDGASGGESGTRS